MPLLERLLAVPATAWSTMQRHVDTAGLSEAAEIRFEPPGYVELVYSLVLVWGFGDALSTLFAAHYAGVHYEANPWIRLLLEFNPLLALALKMAVALYVGVILLECRSVIERVPWWRAWLLMVVAIGAVVVLANTYVGLAAAAMMV